MHFWTTAYFLLLASFQDIVGSLCFLRVENELNFNFSWTRNNFVHCFYGDCYVQLCIYIYRLHLPSFVQVIDVGNIGREVTFRIHKTRRGQHRAR